MLRCEDISYTKCEDATNSITISGNTSDGEYISIQYKFNGRVNNLCTIIGINSFNEAEDLGHKLIAMVERLR